MRPDGLKRISTDFFVMLTVSGTLVYRFGRSASLIGGKIPCKWFLIVQKVSITVFAAWKSVWILANPSILSTDANFG